MKKLILHIGTNKTGTTSIQLFLQKNRTVLKECGVYYPTEGISPLGAHHYIASSVREAPYPPYPSKHSIEEHVSDIMESSKDCDTVVVSSELFFDESGIDSKKLKLLTEPFEAVETIVYLRRQDLYAESFHNSRIRTGAKSVKLENFAQSINVNYTDRLAFWDNFSSEIKIGIFEPKKLVEGDLLLDFMSKANLEHVSGLDFELARTNESVNVLAAETLSLINDITDISQPKRNTIGDFFNDRYPELKNHRLTVVQRTSILEKYETSNIELGKRYLGIAQSPFSDLLPKDVVEHDSVSKDDLINLIAYLCTHKKFK